MRNTCIPRLEHLEAFSANGTRYFTMTYRESNYCVLVLSCVGAGRSELFATTDDYLKRKAQLCQLPLWDTVSHKNII